MPLSQSVRVCNSVAQMQISKHACDLVEALGGVMPEKCTEDQSRDAELLMSPDEAS